MLFTSAATAGILSRDDDPSRSFRIQSQMRYLMRARQGVSSVDVRIIGPRTLLAIGVHGDEVGPRFSDLIWQAAEYASRLANMPVTLGVYEQNMVSLGRQICWLKARKGIVFDGTC
jgi:hypothetical protein